MVHSYAGQMLLLSLLTAYLATLAQSCTDSIVPDVELGEAAWTAAEEAVTVSTHHLGVNLQERHIAGCRRPQTSADASSSLDSITTLHSTAAEVAAALHDTYVSHTQSHRLHAPVL